MIGVSCPLQEELELKRIQSLRFCCVSGVPLALADEIREVSFGFFADASALRGATARHVEKAIKKRKEILEAIEEKESEIEDLQSELRVLKSDLQRAEKTLGIKSK